LERAKMSVVNAVREECDPTLASKPCTTGLLNVTPYITPEDVKFGRHIINRHLIDMGTHIPLPDHPDTLIPKASYGE
jgi:hypothetical protein